MQKTANSVWRRRRCITCGATISSREQVTYEGTLVIRNRTAQIMPFQRDILFVSLLEACQHRASAIGDAAALTESVIGKLLGRKRRIDGVITRDEIIATSGETLSAFDYAAGVHYNAYHKSLKPNE